ncbi:RNA polymerase sigma factor [Paenibacillus alkalitolerans]|uniref:RNA polymerase sigma factor n=1 Tax=Paenibacillus alkalitolerans TaxID=2799335 RepID=UPI0018F7337F|nr:RNA polymerase sigma factor [Paenibacillus alkalitolerans]
MSLFDWFGKKNEAGFSTLEEELTRFYRMHRNIVYAYFFRVTGDREESEELTQETFYQAVKSIHRFKGRSSMKTWLLQIARNMYRNKVRSWVKERKYRDFGEMGEYGDETYNPQRIVMQQNSRQEVVRAFQQLPMDYREVLVLKEIEGLAHADIAQILGKTPQTTKVLLHRAKQKLREHYQSEVLEK